MVTKNTEWYEQNNNLRQRSEHQNSTTGRLLFSYARVCSARQGYEKPGYTCQDELLRVHLNTPCHVWGHVQIQRCDNKQETKKQQDEERYPFRAWQVSCAKTKKRINEHPYHPASKEKMFPGRGVASPRRPHEAAEQPKHLCTKPQHTNQPNNESLSTKKVKEKTRPADQRVFMCAPYPRIPSTPNTPKRDWSPAPLKRGAKKLPQPPLKCSAIRARPEQEHYRDLEQYIDKRFRQHRKENTRIRSARGWVRLSLFETLFAS